MSLKNDIESLLQEVEDAVDEHPDLERSKHGSYLRFLRPVSTVATYVTLRGSRKQPTEIFAEGRTPEDAARRLISSLDYWADVIARGRTR